MPSPPAQPLERCPTKGRRRVGRGQPPRNKPRNQTPSGPQSERQKENSRVTTNLCTRGIPRRRVTSTGAPVGDEDAIHIEEDHLHGGGQASIPHPSTRTPLRPHARKPMAQGRERRAGRSARRSARRSILSPMEYARSLSCLMSRVLQIVEGKLDGKRRRPTRATHDDRGRSEGRRGVVRHGLVLTFEVVLALPLDYTGPHGPCKVPQRELENEVKSRFDLLGEICYESTFFL